MSNPSVKEMCDHIDMLFRNLQIARAVLPYTTNFYVGKREIPTPGYYKEAGYSATIRYDEPLTLGRIKNINDAADSVNQGFVIRLCAFLEHCKVYRPHINKNLMGNDEIDILRRLRNEFAHTPGGYNEEDNEQKKLRNRMIEHFNIPKEELAKIEKKFPISINGVLEPLVEGCRKYIKELNKIH